MRSYFVFFVIDAVDDELANEIRSRVRALARSRAWTNEPGFFDDPAAEHDGRRTTGGYLRVEAEQADGDDVRALCRAIQALSSEFEVDIEMQWRETVLGRIRAGVPDEGLEQRLAEVCGGG